MCFFFRWGRLKKDSATLAEILNRVKEIQMNVSELTNSLTAIQATFEKAKAEIIGKIDNLQAALSNVELPEEAVAALAALQETATSLDDIVPDEVIIEPTPDESAE